MKASCPAARPNLLLLFTDQHRADVLGCEGHPDVLTPQLDALAARGTRFARAYCQDAICVPSRSSMVSGLYPRTLGCLDNGERSDVMDAVPSLASALRANGYRTGAFGKRHLYRGCDAGWDVANDHLGNEPGGYPEWVEARGHLRDFARDWAAEWGGTNADGPAESTDFEPAMLCAQPTSLPVGLTMEAFTADRSVAFMEQAVADDAPFFCWASFYRPHQPYTPLPEYYERFDRSRWGRGRRAGDGLAKPSGFDQPVADLPPMFQARRKVEGRPWGLKAAHDEPQLFRDAIAAYYACLEEIDDHVGTILAALDRLGQRENTIVVYASDHGEFAGNHGIMEKIAPGHNVYEDTLRVPLIVSWPGQLREGEVSTDLAELVDLYPTLLELCGAHRSDAASRSRRTGCRRRWSRRPTSSASGRCRSRTEAARVVLPAICCSSAHPIPASLRTGSTIPSLLRNGTVYTKPTRSGNMRTGIPEYRVWKMECSIACPGLDAAADSYSF